MPTKRYRFRTIEKGGKKAKRGQTKRVRVGARKPGSPEQGSIRRPF